MKVKISNKLKGRFNEKNCKKVYQYNLNGVFIKEWPSTREIERVLNFDNTCISAVCRGKYKQSYGYIWKYVNEVD